MNECLTTPQHKKQIGYWVRLIRSETFVKITFAGGVVPVQARPGQVCADPPVSRPQPVAVRGENEDSEKRRPRQV